ncbi:putative two-component system sensor histidine kinase [Selenomonas ruminantium subsp. lactilytica TAM6421]|uniref:histidine kinase n=2 Tax=Selenomonas ruminantium TaxID=971 RepID=I0GTL1_SELRL|nr:putative two-component system sensor histidine kinase [Selenomonas ruminantium subsp. lactilytica TAM6421]
MFDRLRYAQISTKITCFYAAVLLLVLILTSTLTGLGVFFSFYHQAEVELEMSMNHVLEVLEQGRSIDSDFGRDDIVWPGVVLRITDMTGQIVYENDSRFPSLKRIEEHKVKNPPFWANKKMQVLQFRNATFYHARMDVEYRGQIYQMHFFKTITAEKHFLETLQKILFLMTILGFFLALLGGFFVSRRILQPIRDMIVTARKIEVEKMDCRLPVPPARDELMELAETFNHMLNRLEAGFKQQQRFVSDASHELRTPVTVILGYSDLLSRWGRDDAEVLDEGISSIRSEAENMQQLIEKLLFLARADQKRQVLHKENIELSELLADVMKKMQLVTKEHSVELLQNDDGLMYGDLVTVRQMFRIFLDNSKKYTPAGGRITVTSRYVEEEQGKFMLVDLADNGIGIAPEDQQKVFERFYRVDTSRTKAQGVSGTGLGLSIASWIAEQHGIEITMSSALGKGTTIHLKIPLI